MAKQTKTIYVVEEDDGYGTKVQNVHNSMEDAYYSSEDEVIEVEVYKLVRKVKVTRTETFHEEEV